MTVSMIKAKDASNTSGTRDYAGFQPSSKGPVGKCSNTIQEAEAQQLLNEGIAVPDNTDEHYPQRIVNQHKGAIYVAVPTVPGRSYHGYPWRADLDPRGLPMKVLHELKKRAEASGCLTEYKKWIRDFGPKK